MHIVLTRQLYNNRAVYTKLWWFYQKSVGSNNKLILFNYSRGLRLKHLEKLGFNEDIFPEYLATIHKFLVFDNGSC